MIRRQDKNNWLLIDQVSHARIAADLARAWGNENDVAPLPMLKQLLAAIRWHDEG